MNNDEFSQELERITAQLQQLKTKSPELWDKYNSFAKACGDNTLQDALSALEESTSYTIYLFPHEPTTTSQ